ncbi:MAG: hypothetical protein JWQ38_1507 [Flavipsychrobacter sp.]|nr:hypothetical protein [Flavipsychrobacter sp.]
MKKCIHLLLCVTLSGLSGLVNAQTINTIAGTGAYGYDGDGVAVMKKIYYPFGVTIDPMGNAIIADQSNGLIRKITPAGNMTTIGGIYGIIPYYGDEVQATSTTFNDPYGMYTDPGGNIYIADGNNHRIRKIDPSGVSHTVAGYSLTGGYSGDGGPATAANLYYPTGMATDINGNLFIADYSNDAVRKVDVTTKIITTVASLRRPYNIASDNIGNIYIATTTSIVRMDAAGVFTTIYSNPTGLLKDVIIGLATDIMGNVYAADAHQVYMMTSTGTGLTTLTGITALGYSGDGGPAIGATFNNIGGIALDVNGNIYISDGGNHRIRKITYPVTAIAPITGTTTLCQSTATSLSDATTDGIWLSSNPAVATIGRTTGVLNAIAAGTATITYATLHNSITTVVTVTAPVSIATIGKVLGINYACPATTVILTETVPGGVWTSSNTTVATINNLGLVHAIKPGSAVFTYTLNGACGCSASLNYPFKTLAYEACMNTTAGVATPPNSNTIETIHAWPNPNEGTFTINMESGINEQVHITITNVVGQKIKDLSANTNEPVDVRLDGAPGVYFVNAVSEHGRWSQKVLVNAFH